MKIPTIIALIILSGLIIAGLGAKPYIGQIFPSQQISAPQSITQSNLTPDSVTISWQTESAAPTKIIYTTDKNFLKDLKSASDDRNRQVSRTFHFVTLKNLEPSTTYFFKIGDQLLTNPLMQFTTPPKKTLEDFKSQPIVGSIVNDKLQPITDALVTLEVEGYLPLATYTNQNGNFVLPMLPIYKRDDLSQTLTGQELDLALLIEKDDKTSRIDFRLKQFPSPLPAVILGQDLDLRDYKLTNSANQPSPTPAPNFDVNGDGKINPVDVSTVQSNIDRSRFNPKTDLNGDGKVDQVDLGLIRQAL